jgi:hypothetical protein
MKLDRFRGPALAAAAVLLISGAGIASARTPSAAITAAVAPAVVESEATSPDADNIQEGDQTTPDAGVGAESAGKAAAVVSSTKVVAAPKTTVKAAVAAAPEAPGAPEAAETPGTETGAETPGVSDGPGGHEDPAGQNVDHQFNGEE